MTSHRKPRVLIVNAYLDPWNGTTPTRLFVPRAMAPYYLAGHFSRDHFHIRIWDEFFHGALLERRLFEWPDIVVLTGLTAAFDRARQIAAYCRHANPKVVTVIGGPIARALPGLCERLFDYVCQGDVEDIETVIEAVHGANHISDIPAPRFDLMAPTMGLGYLETTKYCNFRCSFCSLTGEGRGYTAHSDQSIDAQLDAMGKIFGIAVLDNNFYGNNRESFERRVRKIGDRWRKGQFRAWGALVSGDFFKREDNLRLLADNGCKGLFSGVESLDPTILKTFNKPQSLSSHPRTLMEACAAHGIGFDYGMIIDFAQQTIAEVDAQISSILSDVPTPLPALVGLTIPIVGTPYFEESVRAARFMPNVLLSDMDGQKLIEWPREPVAKVQAYLGDLLTFRGRKLALARHAMGHAWHWRKHLDWQQTLIGAVRPLHRYMGGVALGSFKQMRQSRREPSLTYCAMSDTRRTAYQPLYRLPSQFADDFKPLVLTDERGALTEDFLLARSRS